jgi:formylglycine-generating enzyme required for sulfatase activity
MLRLVCLLCATGSLCLSLAAVAAEPSVGRVGNSPHDPYPLWDGRESIEQYAKRVNLPATKTLDLGGGVNLELVLIPAGKFVMGTPEPESPLIGGSVLGITGLVVLILVARLLWRAFRQRRRPQFSLRWLIVVVLIVGVAQYGGFRCWRAVQASRGYWSGESPAHEVTLAKPYYIGKHEVTQGQYAAVMGTNPSNFKGPNLPVAMVSWDDAQAFCKKVNLILSRDRDDPSRDRKGAVAAPLADARGSETDARGSETIVRLPTEAEWERACRAGTTTTYYTGDTEADLVQAAWYGANSGGKTHPVGQKEVNAFGLYDMHGNVWEWCADWYEEYKPGAVVDPQGPTEGQYRVLRGGSWGSNAWICRSAYRAGSYPDSRSHDFGFRVVVERQR